MTEWGCRRREHLGNLKFWYVFGFYLLCVPYSDVHRASVFPESVPAVLQRNRLYWILGNGRTWFIDNDGICPVGGQLSNSIFEILWTLELRWVTLGLVKLQQLWVASCAVSMVGCSSPPDAFEESVRWPCRIVLRRRVSRVPHQESPRPHSRKSWVLKSFAVASLVSVTKQFYGWIHFYRFIGKYFNNDNSLLYLRIQKQN